MITRSPTYPMAFPRAETRGALLGELVGRTRCGVERIIVAAALHHPEMIAHHVKSLNGGAIHDALLRDLLRSALADMRLGLRPSLRTAWRRAREMHQPERIEYHQHLLARAAELLDHNIVERAIRNITKGAQHGSAN